MKHSFPALFAGILCLFVALSVGALEPPAPTYLRLPPMPQAPVIDGKTTPDEWLMASPAFGSYSQENGMLSLREVHHAIGYNGDCLFVSQRSELPLAPMELSAEDKIIVAFGKDTLKTVVFSTDGACQTPGITAAVQRHDGVLDFEASIPWAAFGLAGIQEGEEYKLQITREYQNLHEVVTWSWGDAGVFVPQSGIPAVGFKTFGNRWKGTGYDIQWSAANPGLPQAQVKVDALMVSIEPPQHLNTTIAPKAGEELTAMLRGILSPLDRTITSTITDLLDGKLLYRRDFSWHAGKGVAFVDPDPPYVLDIAVLPTKHLAKAKVSCISQKKLDAIGQVFFRIVGKDGTIYSQQPAENFQARWEFPELPLGEYDLVAELLDDQGELHELKRNFAIRNFPWQGLNIGLKHIVLPPYTPLKYDTDGTVRGLQTTYHLGNALWDSIQVPGGELLSAPVQMTIDGMTVNAASEPLVADFPEEHDRIILETALSSEKGVDIQLRQEYDFDGFCKVTMTLAPIRGPVNLSEVRMDIPLKSEDVKYVCALGNGMRKNIHKELSRKEGVIWGSLDESAWQYRNHGFRPYIWLGETYRGMAFVCETPLNWERAPKSSAQEIIRDGDTTYLRLNFANKAFMLDKPRTIVFALQATPTRPQDSAWRKQCGTMHNAQNPKEALCAEYNISNYIRFMCARVDDGVAQVPNDDWSFVDYMIADKWETEAEVRKFAQEYLDRNGITDENFTRWKTGLVEKGDDLQTRMYQGCRFWKNTQIHFAYMNPRASCPSWPEWEMYIDEWYQGAWRPLVPQNSGYSGLPVADYIDFLLWNTLRLIDKGWNGLYLDNLYDCVCEDPEMSPYGPEAVPMWHFFAIRELVRRVAVTSYERGLMLNGRPLLMIHMTDCNVVPWLSLASHSLDWEMNFGDKPFPQRFSDAYLQTDTLGTQTGTTPFVIVNSLGSNGIAATQSMLALTITYGLLAQTDAGLTRPPHYFQQRDAIWDFGYGNPTTQVFPCWMKENPVQQLTKGVKCCYVKRADSQAMLLVGNLTDTDATGEFVLPEDYTVVDAETNEEIPVGADRRLVLPVKAYSPAILYLKPILH